MAADVFISYVSDDRVLAEDACNQLENVGIRCWIAPRDLKAGSDWSAAIVRAIEDSCLILVIISEKTLESKHVLREVERADSNKKQIIPFLVGDIKLGGWVAYYMGAVQIIHASVNPTDDELKTLVAEIQNSLKGEAKDEQREKLLGISITDEDLIALGRSICWNIREVLEGPISPEDEETIREPEHGQQVKFIDLNCNRLARQAISRWESKHGCNVLLTGEDIDKGVVTPSSEHPPILCCLDSLDGTQHWLRARNLYCTAVSIFRRSQQQDDPYRLRVSIIQNADGTVFVAREDQASAFIDGEEKPIHVPTNSIEEIRKAQVCTVARRPAHYQVLGPHLKEGSPFAGLYTFGGNPILAELALGRYDAVFQPDAAKAGSSQAIWDWLPGGHIAYRSGCTILHLDGRDFDVPTIAESSLKSGSLSYPYVAAANRKLALNIIRWLTSIKDH